MDASSGGQKSPFFELSKRFHVSLTLPDGSGGSIVSAALIPPHIEDGTGLILGCLDGSVKYLFIPNRPTSDVIPIKVHGNEDYLFQIKSGRYPVSAIATISHDFTTIVAYAGTEKVINLIVRDNFSSPDFFSGTPVPVPDIVNCLVLRTISLKDDTWLFKLYCGLQDYKIHMYSFRMKITRQQQRQEYDLEKFSECTFVGHRSFVRCLAFPSYGQETFFCSAGDDFCIKKWAIYSSSSALSNENTDCVTYEEHENDVICLASFENILCSGSKDHSIVLWNIDPKLEKVQKIKKIATPSIVRSLAFFQGKDLVLCGGGDGALRSFYYDIWKKQWVPSQSFELHSEPIESIFITNSNELITTSRDPIHSVAVWTIRSSL